MVSIASELEERLLMNNEGLHEKRFPGAGYKYMSAYTIYKNLRIP